MWYFISMSKKKREISPRNRGILDMLADGREWHEIRTAYEVRNNAISSVITRFADRYLEMTGKEVRRERRLASSLENNISSKIPGDEDLNDDEPESSFEPYEGIEDGESRSEKVDLEKEKRELLKDLIAEVESQRSQER
jgi:hypothetical protein